MISWRTGQLIRTLPVGSATVSALAWSPDARKVAGAVYVATPKPLPLGPYSGFPGYTYASSINIWNAQTGELIRREDYQGKLCALAWSPDSAKVVAGCDDNTAKVWNAQTGGILTTLTGHASAVVSVSWSPDGSSIAGGAADGTIDVWKNPVGLTYKTTVIGHAGSVNSLMWSPDSKWLASASDDKTIRIWGRKPG
jgi:WD40 repeat protein